MENTASPALLEGQKSLQDLMKFVWAMVAIGILSAFVAVGTILFSIITLSSLDSGAPMAAMYASLGFSILVFILAIALSIFIAKNLAKGRNWARWVYLVMAVWGIYSGTGSLGAAFNGSFMGFVLLFLFVGGTALQIYICVQLFKSPARLVFLQDRLQRMEKDLRDLKG